MKQRLGLVALLCAYILLVPGLLQPMITLTGTVEKAEMVALSKQLITNHPRVPDMVGNMAGKLIDQVRVKGTIPVYHKTRSILGTVQELFDARSYLVAFLIALFSIIVPVTKGLLMIITYFQQHGRLKKLGIRIGNLISKWSMADVFVIAIIVAYLAANATKHTDELFVLNAEFGPGFYYFLSYCLLSVLSVQLMGRFDGETQCSQAAPDST